MEEDKINEKNNSSPDSDSDLTFEEDTENVDGEIKGKALATISKLRARLKQAEAEKLEYLTGWQRAKADFINTRKQDEENNRHLAKFAKKDLVLELITVLDSFDMAMASKESWEKLPEVWRKGVEHIHSQLLSVLGGSGLKELNPAGDEFDPSKEESLGFVDTEKAAEDGKILQVLQKGYTLHDKLLRPAKVKIGRHINKNINN